MSLIKKIATIACAGILASTLVYNSWALPIKPRSPPPIKAVETEEPKEKKDYRTEQEKEIDRYDPMILTIGQKDCLFLGWDRNKDGKEDLLCKYQKIKTGDSNRLMLKIIESYIDPNFDGEFYLRDKVTETGYEKIKEISFSEDYSGVCLGVDSNNDGKIDKLYNYSQENKIAHGDAYEISFTLQMIRKDGKIEWHRMLADIENMWPYNPEYGEDLFD